MPYDKQTWSSRIRQFANRIQLVASGTPNVYDVIQVEGAVTEEGTGFSPARMQYIEDGIEQASKDADDAVSAVNSVDQLASYLNDVDRYNMYGMQLETYYRGISYYKRLTEIEGFINTALSDPAQLTAKLDTGNKKLTAPDNSTYVNIGGSVSGLQFGNNTNSQYIGQVFTTPAYPIVLKQVTQNMARNGASTLVVSAHLYAVSGGIPTTLLSSSPTTLNSGTFGTSYPATACTFNFNDVELLANTQYAIVFKTHAVNSVDYAYLYDGGSYANGTKVTYISNVWTAGANDLLTFKVYGVPAGEKYYQTVALDQQESFDLATVYASVLETNGAVEFYIASDPINPSVFNQMVEDTLYSRSVSSGYTEKRYFLQLSPDSKVVKLKIALTSPTSGCEVKCYGLLLGGKSV